MWRRKRRAEDEERRNGNNNFLDERKKDKRWMGVMEGGRKGVDGGRNNNIDMYNQFVFVFA